MFAMDSLQLEDNFHDCIGKQVTTLFEVWGYDETHKGHRCRTALRGTLFRYNGFIPKESTVFLAIGAEVSQQGNTLGLQLSANGSLHSRPPMELKNITKVIETCSGIGCLGQGLKKAGFSVVLRNDFNASLLGVSQKIDECPVVIGDINDDETMAQICRQVPYSCTTAAGVSCQPHSKLGDRQGRKDDRSTTLPRTLKTAFLTRQLAIILECVEEVQTSSWAQAVIGTFAKVTGYRVTQGTLHLQHVWPTRRSRWWCILTHKMLGQVPWLDFPIANPRPMVIDVLPAFKPCTAEELKQLRLDDYDLGKFNSVGLENNLIPTNGVMKTSLHSCGCQLSACACGCRKFPFGEERINQRGLHGHLVKLGDIVNTASGPIPACRHIHPAELSLLNGMYCDVEWGPNLKLSLTGIGQLASPLQATWIGALIMQHCIHEQILPGDAIHPKQVLLSLMNELLDQRDKIFGAPETVNAKNFQRWVSQGILFQQPPLTKPKIVHMPVHASGKTSGVHQHTQGTGDQWVCDYKGCPVCEPNVKTTPASSFGLPTAIAETQGISPTIPFDVQSQPNSSLQDRDLLQASIVAEQQIQQGLPPSNGGIVGFEAPRGIKRPSDEVIPPKSKPFTSGIHQHHQQESPESRDIKTSRTDKHLRSEASLGFHEGFGIADMPPKKTIQIRVLNLGETQPQTIEVPEGITPAQIIPQLCPEHQHASVVLRTGVATHLPRHEPIAQGQFLRVEQLHSETILKCGKVGTCKPNIQFPTTRIAALWNQKSWVAQDEMNFYMQTLAASKVTVIPSVEVKPGLDHGEAIAIVEKWFQNGHLTPDAFKDQHMFVSAIIWHHHWIPIAFYQGDHDIQVMIPPDNGDFEAAIGEWCHANFAQWDMKHKLIPLQFQGDCGFQSFAWLVASVNGNTRFNQLESLTPYHAEYWRSLFETYIITNGKANDIVTSLGLGGAKQEEIREQLQQLLTQHGVWKDRVDERSNHIMSNIPTMSLKSILNSPRPWQDLKQAANACTPPIKLIMSDELQAQIQSRVKTTNKIGHKGKKISQKAAENIQIVAEDLEIPTGVFRQVNGQVIGNIAIQSIGPNAAGVAIVNASQAEPILRLKQPVSQHGLAIIVLATPDSSPRTSNHLRLHVPIGENTCHSSRAARKIGH